MFRVVSYISFNQFWNPRDLKHGGNCYAYAVLMFDYISMFRLQNPTEPIDYSSLINALKKYEQNKKHALSDHQSIITEDYKVDSKPILDDEIAIFNENTSSLQKEIKITEFAQVIFNTIQKFENPFFCFFHYWDNAQRIAGIDLNHATLFYIPSPNEMLFFDANSGMHVLALPDVFTKNDLEKNIIELIFKKNMICKWLINSHSQTLFCNYNMSIVKDKKLNDYQEKVKLFLLDFIKDQTLQPENFSSSQTQKYLERNMFIIRMQNSKQTSLVLSKKILIGAPLFLALYYQTEKSLLSRDMALLTLITLFLMSKLITSLDKSSNQKKSLESVKNKNNKLKLK